MRECVRVCVSSDGREGSLLRKDDIRVEMGRDEKGKGMDGVGARMG